MKLKDVVDSVRKIAVKRPKTTYQSDAGDCCYTSGRCSDDTQGCLVGQALTGLGVQHNVLEDNEYLGVEDLMENLGLWSIGQISEDKYNCIHWLEVVQAKQDDGMQWGKAVKEADKELKVLKKALKENEQRAKERQKG